MEKKTEVKASLLDKILAKLGVKTLEEAEQAVAEPQAKAEPKAHAQSKTASKAAVLPKNNTATRRTKKKKS